MLAALCLENEGLLSLDAPVLDTIDGYDGPDDETLKFRRFLENRSGLADGLMPGLRSDPELPTRSVPAAEAANRFAAANGPEPPGEAFEYLNSNWILVHAILEQAGSAPIADQLDTWLFYSAGVHTAAVFVGDVEGLSVRPASGGYMPLPDFVSCAGGFRRSHTISWRLQPFRLSMILSTPTIERK